MTFIEVHANESEPAMAKLIADPYTSTYNEAPPPIHLGRTIVWQERMFRELCLPSNSMALQHENLIFHAAVMPHDRAGIMVGSYHGAVFTTPPVAGAELAARVIDCGRCRPEIAIRPFSYSVYDRET